MDFSFTARGFSSFWCIRHRSSQDLVMVTNLSQEEKHETMKITIAFFKYLVL